MDVQHGGAEVFVKNLLIALRKRNPENEYQLWVLHDAEELTCNDKKAIEFEKKYIESLKLNNIKVIAFHKKDGFFERIKLYRKINYIYRKEKPEIIHCHLETVTFNICLALMLKKAIIVETIHNTKINHPKIQKYFISKKVKKIVSIANIVSEEIKKQITHNKKKVIQIYNGVNIDEYKCNRIFTGNDEYAKIVAIGRLVDQKNHLMLIKAFDLLEKRLKKEGKKAPRLSIYGQGECRNDIVKYITENKIENIELMGITSNIEEVLKNSDIYVMSSIYEGFSISLIEALVSGIAIVCTNVGGNKEIIGEKAGILVESENIEKMAEALYSVLDKKEMKKLYDECLKRRNIFDINKCGEEHIRLYREIIKMEKV